MSRARPILTLLLAVLLGGLLLTRRRIGPVEGTARATGDDRGVRDVGNDEPAAPSAPPVSPPDEPRTADPATREQPRRPRRRRWVPSSLRTVLGLVLVASGLGVLGWVGWQYYGTDLVSRQAQQALVQRTEEAWEAQGTGEEPEAPLEVGAAEALIQVPRFGDDYVMPVQTGVGDDVLAEGFGHFEGAADPGERGNYALAAHRVTHGEPLRRMPELRPGDEVVVTTRDAVHTYVMDTDPEDLVIGFENVWVVDPAPVNPTGGVGPSPQEDRLLTLTTCAELFHTDTRMIAFGHLVSSEVR